MRNAHRIGSVALALLTGCETAHRPPPTASSSPRTLAAGEPCPGDPGPPVPAAIRASGASFPTEGCWEVTGDIGVRPLTFVTMVRKVSP